MTPITWAGSTWERVCSECFESNEGKMLEHAIAYLKADLNNVPPELHLGTKFREIVGARNRKQWWTTARDVLTDRASTRLASPTPYKKTDTSQAPVVVGRRDDGSEDPRAPTRLVARASQNFGLDTLHAELFESTDQEDRGGVVLRLRTEEGGMTFYPTARLVDGGVEIHMAGAFEGEALLNLLQLLTQFGRSPSMRGMSFERKY